MLTSSFVLLKGVGQSSERRLWQEGILDWAAFLRSSTLPGISSTRKEWYDQELARVPIKEDVLRLNKDRNALIDQLARAMAH